MRRRQGFDIAGAEKTNGQKGAIVMRGLVGLAILVALSAAGPAFAIGTEEQRAACTDDAYRYCNNYIPDAYAVERCLRANIAGLSPACRRELGVARKPRRG
jgi:hypothetical protein